MTETTVKKFPQDYKKVESKVRRRTVTWVITFSVLMPLIRIVGFRGQFMVFVSFVWMSTTVTRAKQAFDYPFYSKSTA